MKTIYKCEKCGKEFDNWDDAYQCESIHLDIDTGKTYQNEVTSRSVYKDGNSIPSLVILPFTEYNDGEYKTTYTWFKLDCIVKEPELKNLLDEIAEREERERIQAEEWRKEREAREAKKAEESED